MNPGHTCTSGTSWSHCTDGQNFVRVRLYLYNNVSHNNINMKMQKTIGNSCHILLPIATIISRNTQEHFAFAQHSQLSRRMITTVSMQISKHYFFNVKCYIMTPNIKIKCLKLSINRIGIILRLLLLFLYMRPSIAYLYRQIRFAWKRGVSCHRKTKM